MENTLKFTCGKCKNKFLDCIYWFDSLYYAKFDHRKIIPFCGPKCVDEWHKENNVKDWELRKQPYPKGEEWDRVMFLHPHMFQSND